MPVASVNQCCAAVEGADQLSLMDLMTDGSNNNTPPFPKQMKNTNILFPIKLKHSAGTTTMTANMTNMVINKTKWPRQVRDLILDSVYLSFF